MAAPKTKLYVDICDSHQTKKIALPSAQTALIQNKDNTQTKPGNFDNYPSTQRVQQRVQPTQNSLKSCRGLGLWSWRAEAKSQKPARLWQQQPEQIWQRVPFAMPPAGNERAKSKKVCTKRSKPSVPRRFSVYGSGFPRIASSTKPTYVKLDLSKVNTPKRWMKIPFSWVHWLLEVNPKCCMSLYIPIYPYMNPSLNS